MVCFSSRLKPGVRNTAWIGPAVERLWREAAHAHRRHYEVGIYSDHGQSRATSYFKLQGYDILEAANAVYAGLDESVPIVAGRKRATGVEAQRARLLGGSKVRHLFSMETNGGDESNCKVQVAGRGPVGFVYFPKPLEPTDCAIFEYNGPLPAATATGLPESGPTPQALCTPLSTDGR